MNAEKPDEETGPPSAPPALSGERGTGEIAPEALAELMAEIGLPSDDPRAARIHTLVSETQIASYTSGPIPSASEMMAYKAVDPALPNRIFADAETRRDHRHKMEEARVTAETSRAKLSQVFAFGIALAGIVGAALVGYLTGNTILAGIVVILGIGGPNAASVAIRVLGRDRTAQSRGLLGTSTENRTDRPNP